MFGCNLVIELLSFFFWWIKLLSELNRIIETIWGNGSTISLMLGYKKWHWNKYVQEVEDYMYIFISVSFKLYFFLDFMRLERPWWLLRFVVFSVKYCHWLLLSCVYKVITSISLSCCSIIFFSHVCNGKLKINGSNYVIFYSF